MKKKPILIKEESLPLFLNRHCVELGDDMKVSNARYDHNVPPSHILKDEIVIKGDGVVSEGDTVIMELTDTTNKTNDRLKHRYHYKAAAYDSVSMILTIEKREMLES